ncbi:MAG: aminoacyl-tRNA hydrolase [Patescibacteria group bacterium]|nr:aminoacyl-tRNA hydrolase [Patescibacteria group bacterium]
MSKLVVGLGNPGEEYKNTRHNAGFLVIDLLRSVRSICRDFSSLEKTSTDFAVMYKCDDVFLLKPQTGMNSSGEAVAEIVREKSIDLDNLLVIHDDLDLGLGDYKLQKYRGAAGHNGVQSIIGSLGTKNFWRLRLGIGLPSQGIDAADYVLALFSDKELNMVKSLTENELVAVIKEWIED